MKIDIVIPIYNEQENLPELFNRLREVFDRLGTTDFQVICVNDGSTDRSMEMMQDQCKQDSRFSVISLSRNFGHQAAISAGLASATDDAVILMDGYLQDPPELIPDLLKHWQDVVTARSITPERPNPASGVCETTTTLAKWVAAAPPSGVDLDIKQWDPANWSCFR